MKNFLGIDRTPPALEDRLVLQVSSKVNYQQI